ncbi:site-specific integrase [Jatrophihabitans sp. GAS493]|uniref:tyrosine-type recombinase/integrase n=1 Tax=Jatrophihabitans sp. GAS493 TaxID=1907575 RepID=UPI0018D51AFF|nr:site-specific integrase [Jatrophihabitans sp. GAS493]
MRSAPTTFGRKKDAELFLVQTQSDMARDDWIDIQLGEVPIVKYATDWLNERPGLSETTWERYESALRRQIVPLLGDIFVGDLREARVRRWRKELLDQGVGHASVAKAYSLLRTIMNTAVDDGMIRRNPCRIKGGGAEQSPERPVLTLPEVFAAANAVPAHFRVLVLFATFTSLRFGELAALRRSDLDLAAGLVTVRRSQAELRSGRLKLKEPKSAAGRRVVPIPAAMLPDLKAHLEKFSESGRDGVVFVGPAGGVLRRQNFRRIWIQALTTAEVPQVHFHDLRHTGNSLAAESGATLRDLMDRMGHSSTRAALIYLHSSSRRGQAIADHISEQIEASKAAETEGDDAPETV